MKKWILTGIACVALGSAPAAMASTFGRPMHLTLSYSTHANVAIGDADGDGLKDLAVTTLDANGFGGQLSVYFQRKDGTLASPGFYSLQDVSGFAYSVVFADLDHDGRQETVVGGQNGGLTVMFWRNGRRRSWMHHAGPVTGCAFMATGDVDGDGNPDIACHSGYEAASNAVLFYGDGRGGFRESRLFPTQAGRAGLDLKSLQLADVTGDGHVDLVITASSADKFYVFPNDGHGGLLASVAYAHPASSTGVYPSSLIAADLDGDGANEVITASVGTASAGGKLNIYRQTAGGTLLLSEQTPIYYNATALVYGDAGGDGDQDFVTAHYGVNAATVIGEGSGGDLSQQARYELPGFGNAYGYVLVSGSASLALGDLNHDGCNDLAAGTYSGITILYGCQPYRTSIPVSDFDGDGVSDLFWRTATGEKAIWPWAKGFYYGTNIGITFKEQVIGDFNGDGNSDVVLRDASNGNNKMISQGLVVSNLAALPGAEWTVAGAGDFDGDDHSDLLWRNSTTGANAIWKSANSATPQSIAAITDLNWKIVGVGDFDGDGRSDIFWRHATSGINAVWKAGDKANQLPVAAIADVHWQVVGTGDFDADGRDDVAWRNNGTGANTIWLSANSATPQAVTSSTDPHWVVGAVGDYNGDGHSDLFWRNTSTGANVIWLSGDSRRVQAVATMDASSLLIR